MCDTFVATGSVTSTGNMIFGKNSDREPNESQALERFLRRRSKSGAPRRLTFIEIPDAEESFEILVSRPFHMVGAEMGVNEHGLVLGNEAVFTKVPIPRRNDGLTGMDMLRLTLERCRTTNEAVHFLGGLLEQYGQDACGGYMDRKMFYHNSFLIADGVTARVFETAGRFWASAPVEGYYAISNGLTIGEDFDLSSPNLPDVAQREGYRKRNEAMHFARVFSDRFYTAMSRCSARRELSTHAGLSRSSKPGGFSLADAFAVLRSHAPQAPDDPSRMGMRSVCLHASGLLTPHQTTGSLVVEVGAPRSEAEGKRSALKRIFATGTSSPCLSVFKPVAMSGRWLTAEGNGDWIIPGAREDDSLWWWHEGLHRRVLAHYASLAPLLREDQQRLEGEGLERSGGISVDDPRLKALSIDAFARHRAQIHRWREDVRSRLLTIPSPFRPLYRGFWRRQNEVLSRSL